MRKLMGLFAGLTLAISSQVFAYSNYFNAGIGMIVYYDAECQSMLPGKMATLEQAAAEKGFPKSQWANDVDASHSYVSASEIGCKTIWTVIEEQSPIIASLFR
jgi:hypothetical protein